MGDDAIPPLLAEEIDQAHISPGIVVGTLDSKDRRILTYGRSGAGNYRALDGDTVFDVGSITKVFTALLLADMSVRGEMGIDDEIAKYLPADVRVPRYRGRAITLRDLATYAAGLPDWPEDMAPLSVDKPFPDYSVAQLYASLSGRILTVEPGTQYIYSNFGFGLLGVILARHAGTDFESLVVSRICQPLGMESTRTTPTPAMRPRVAPGYFQLAQVTSWNLPRAFAGTGALRSTANDLLRFVEAAMDMKRTPLSPAFAEMLKAQRPADTTDTSAATGWFVTSGHDDRLVWKNGGILGYASFMGYSTTNHKGIVVLANGVTEETSVLGKHLLNASFPLPR